MRTIRTTLLALSALAVPAAAWAVAVPVSPVGGTKVATPTLTWTKAAGDLVDEVAIASSAAVDANGALLPENVVDSTAPGNNATTWTSTNSGLWAGRYWWVVKTHTTAAPTPVYSAPASFTLATTLRCSPPRGQAKPRHRLYLTISCITNAHAIRVRIVVKRKGGSKAFAKTVKVAAPNDAQAGATFTWKVPSSVAKGTRLGLAATVSAGGVVRKTSATALAP